MQLNQKSSNNFGFTLIELLVVIGIIAVLASIIVAFLSGARAKASDSAIKSEMSSLKSQASLYAAGNGNSFDNLFTSNNTWASSNSGVSAILTNIDNKSSIHSAGSSASAWAVQARLISDTTQYLCIDSTFVFKTNSNVLSPGATVCP